MTHKLWQNPVSQISIYVRTSNGVLNLLSCLATVWGQIVDSLVSFKPYADKYLWFKKFSEWSNRWSSVANLCLCVTCPFLTYYISLVLCSCKWKDRALKKKNKKTPKEWNFSAILKSWNDFNQMAWYLSQCILAHSSALQSYAELNVKQSKQKCAYRRKWIILGKNTRTPCCKYFDSSDFLNLFTSSSEAFR